MKIAALLLFFVGRPALAGDCLSRLESALRSGAGASAAAPPCFEADARWLDDEGAAQGTEAVRQGLERLSQYHRAGAVLDWVRLSTGTWLLGGIGSADDGGPAGQWRHLVLDLSGGAGVFSAGRVYVGARPWPGESAVLRDSSRSGEEVARIFNALFGSGRVDAFLEWWAPDGEFVSAIGPFVGPEISGFFRQQALRYESPNMVEVIDHGPSPDRSTVFEGALTGRCRSNGNRFKIPFLMRMGWSGTRIGRIYEAFSTIDEGCGRFWTTPR